MSAPDLAYRIACAPVAVIGGSNAQLVALLVACRWAQPDGRFILRQSAIKLATGLSERPVSSAVAALRSSGVFSQIEGEEWQIRIDALLRIGGSDRRNGGNRILGTNHSEEAIASEKDAGTSSTHRTARRGAPPGEAVRASEKDVGTAEKDVGAAAGTKSVNRSTVVLSSSSPVSIEQEEGERARAREADDDATHAAADADGATGELSAFAWEPTEAESKTLAWVNAQGLPWELPDGTDLRREWLSTLRHLKPREAIEVRQRMAGDTPSAFRKAMGADLTALRQERARSIAEPADPYEPAPAPTAPPQGNRRDAEREESAAAAERKAKLQAEEQARERGPFLEQGRALLADIDAADPRRIALADPGWVRAVQRLRTQILEQGRAASFDLVIVRSAWPVIRDRALPPEPPPTPEPPRHEPAELDQDSVDDVPADAP
jgi:hypothetical protein